MKWIVIFLIVCAAFFSGLHFGSSRTPQKIGICLDFADLSKEEMQEYLDLKDQKQKYEKANEILAKIMQIFIADMSLHAQGEQSCKINTAEFPVASPHSPRPPRKVQSPPPPPPSPTVATAAPVDRIKRNFKLDEDAVVGVKRPSSRAPRKSSEGKAPLTPAESAGAVRALYQAILWRAADTKGETAAAERFSREGWQTFIRIGQTMIRGEEFLKQIEPRHTPQQIINHLYAVFIGRCAFQDEMKNHMDSLGGNGPAELVETLIEQARNSQTDQIYAGGFSPSSCAAN